MWRWNSLLSPRSGVNFALTASWKLTKKGTLQCSVGAVNQPAVQIYANIFISRLRAFITRRAFLIRPKVLSEYKYFWLNAAESECVFKSKSCLLWEMSFLHRPPPPQMRFRRRLHHAFLWSGWKNGPGQNRQPTLMNQSPLGLGSLCIYPGSITLLGCEMQFNFSST